MLVFDGKTIHQTRTLKQGATFWMAWIKYKVIGNSRHHVLCHLPLFGLTVQLVQPHLVTVQNDL
jgi:hypothetical protein